MNQSNRRPTILSGVEDLLPSFQDSTLKILIEKYKAEVLRLKEENQILEEKLETLLFRDSKEQK